MNSNASQEAPKGAVENTVMNRVPQKYGIDHVSDYQLLNQSSPPWQMGVSQSCRLTELSGEEILVIY
jgi:hypothetical protein